MLTLKQLQTPATEDEALDEILKVLKELGFQATSWQSGSVQLTILRLVAKVFATLSNYISDNVNSGFVKLARRQFLTYLAKYTFDRERLAATPTKGKILLTASAAAPIHSWNAGELIIANGVNGDLGVVSYHAVASGSINPGTSVLIDVECDIPGAVGNIANNQTLYIWTPLVGVSATNPVIDQTNTWILTPGTDEESDERLIDRCIARWYHLAYGNTEGAYRGWALEALPALTRVVVRGAPGDGNVYVIGATALGGLDADQITTIEDYINGVTDGVGRRPINDILNVESATLKTDVPLTMDVYVQSQYKNTAESAIETAELELFGSIPIGGEKLTVPSQGYVFRSKIDFVAQGVEGVKAVHITSPTSDVALAKNEIYSPTITINVIESL